MPVKRRPKKMVSVIIPAYKQEKTILKDLRNIDDALSKIRFDYEIIVVVDGFSDSTYEKVQKIGRKNIKVLGYSNHRGRGYALRYGVARAMGLHVFLDLGLKLIQITSLDLEQTGGTMQYCSGK